MPSPHLAVRSLAFAPDGTPYALIRRGTELHVARLYDDRIEWIRAVGQAAWWFRIDGGATTGVFADDDHVVPLIAYALGGAGRGARRHDRWRGEVSQLASCHQHLRRALRRGWQR